MHTLGEKKSLKNDPWAKEVRMHNHLFWEMGGWEGVLNAMNGIEATGSWESRVVVCSHMQLWSQTQRPAYSTSHMRCDRTLESTFYIGYLYRDIAFERTKIKPTWRVNGRSSIASDIHTRPLAEWPGVSSFRIKKEKLPGDTKNESNKRIPFTIKPHFRSEVASILLP